EKLFPGASLEAPLTGNPTHHLWERLLMTGFPFVKAELLYRNPARLWIEHWEVVLQSLGHDTDLVRAHLTEMHRTRPFPRKRPSMFKARLYELASFFVSNQSVQEMREWNHRRI